MSPLCYESSSLKTKAVYAIRYLTMSLFLCNQKLSMIEQSIPSSWAEIVHKLIHKTFICLFQLSQNRKNGQYSSRENLIQNRQKLASEQYFKNHKLFPRIRVPKLPLL